MPVTERKAPEPFWVWPENLLAVTTFRRLSRQWIWVVAGNRIAYDGIRVEAIRATLELMGIKRKKWPRLFGELRVMEAAALPVLNEE